MLKIKFFSALLFVSVMLFSIKVGADHFSWSGSSFSHFRGHPSFSLSWGRSFYPRRYYYPYYPYYPPRIVRVPMVPPVYIERSESQSSQHLPAGYWYYCTNPNGYYPHVKECQAGWLQVNPIPPSTK